LTVRALVLGAGGFIGTHLCRALAERDYEVVAVGRSRKPMVCGGNEGAISWVRGNFADRKLLQRALEGCSVAFHLISDTAPALSNADPSADVRETVIATVQFLELAKSSDLKRVIFVSSGGTVYGIPSQVPISETAPTDPLCAYGINKLMIEKYLALYHYFHALEYCVLRVANAFGELQSTHHQQGVIAAFMKATVNGEPITIWGDGSVIRDYIYVGDVVDALVKASEVADLSHRVINIGSGTGMSVLDVANAIQDISAHRLEKCFTPARKVDVPEIVLDIGRAKQVLGWAPSTPWQTAIERTYRWYDLHARDRVREQLGPICLPG